MPRSRTSLVLAAGLLAVGCTPPRSSLRAEGTEGGACYMVGLRAGSCGAGLVCSTAYTCIRVGDSGPAADITVWQGGSNDEADVCACETGHTRCNGNKAQTCHENKNWTTDKTCASPEVCVFGECAQRTTECPLTGEYDHEHDVISEEYAAEMVTDCLDGGPSGRTVSVTDNKPVTIGGQPVTLERSLVQSTGFNECGADTKKALDFEQIYGMPTSGSVKPNPDPFTRAIPAGQYAVLYRQLLRIARPASLWRGSAYWGLAFLYDYEFNYDWSLASSCAAAKAKLPTSPPVGAVSCLTGEFKCICPK